MTMQSAWRLQNIVYAVYLRTEHDADVMRRENSRAAIDAWRGAVNASDRAAAARLILRAARRYGLRPPPRTRKPFIRRYP